MTIVWALVVLGVVGAMSTAAAWQWSAARRALEHRQHKLQAVWLARSGAELAAARLLADADGYTGEVVEPIPEAQVRITVEKDPDRPGAYRIRCEARYPVGDPRELTHTVARSVTRRADGTGLRVELADTGEVED